MTRKN